MKRLLPFLSLIILFIIPITTRANSQLGFSTTTINGETYFFNNAEDKLYFEQLQSSQMERYYNPIKSRETFLRNVSYKRKWVAFNPNTPTWSKAGYYNITRSRGFNGTISFSHKGAKVSAAVNISSGVTINIPADKNKESRLGYEADVVVKEYRVDVIDTSKRNRVIRSFVTYRPVVTNTYNVVRYK